MLARERIRYFDGKGGGRMLIIDNDAFEGNMARVQGLWALLVSDWRYQCVIRSLRWEVGQRQFAAVGTGLLPLASDGRTKLAWVCDEGYVTRRRLEERLTYFDEIGADGHWYYFDLGVGPDAPARRLLMGERPLGPVVEFDFRGTGDTPSIREYRI
jgi:hypothetical protein